MMGRTLFSFLICVFINGHLSIMAQKPMDGQALSIVEKMPGYPGGADSLMKDIVSNMVYPKQCVDSGIQGKVYLRFVVNEDGSISNIEVIKGPHTLLNQAAVDAAKAIPKKFAPGMQDGKVVKVWYSLPVSFKIKVIEPKPALNESAFGEKDSLEKNKFIEVSPQFPGGDGALIKCLQKNIHYPERERNNGISGKVTSSFVVDTDGTLTDIHVIKGVSPGLDSEAVRVLSLLPKFIPGTQQGKPVKVKFTLPVSFNLLQGSWGAVSEPTLFDYYPGNYEAFEATLYKNMRYPFVAKAKKTEAILSVTCKFNETLKLVAIKVINDIDSDLNSEAIRLLNLTVPFKSEIKNTKFFKEEQDIFVTFTLDPRHDWNRASSSTFADEDKANVSYYKGVDYFEKGDYKTAIEYFSYAVRDYSLHGKAFFNCAVAELKLNDSDRACDDFKRAYLLGELDALKGIKQACK
jgi:TonB family protein